MQEDYRLVKDAFTWVEQSMELKSLIEEKSQINEGSMLEKTAALRQISLSLRNLSSHTREVAKRTRALATTSRCTTISNPAISNR